MKQVIGFASQYYTLWMLTIRAEESQFERRKVFEYTFVKNISHDLEVAKQKYPNATIDLTLRGHTNICRSESEKINQDLFQFGRYQGTKISNCTDLDYLYWYVRQVLSDENKKHCLDVLLAHGYGLEGEFVFTPEEMEQRRIIKKEIADLEDSINKGYIELQITSNVLFEKEDLFIVLTDKRLRLIFSEAKSLMYNGYEYYLPIINGKAKKLKNKHVRVHVKNYEKQHDLGDLLITDFELETIKNV